MNPLRNPIRALHRRLIFPLPCSHGCLRRLQAIATPLVPNMEKVQIIPPPKDVDPRVLAWKGAAVLGKMDGVADLWITAADWVRLCVASCPQMCKRARRWMS